MGDTRPLSAEEDLLARLTDDPATHDPRCIAVSRWHVGECYLPPDGEPR
jgi:hypothetical protein